MSEWSGINDDDSGFEGTYFDRVVRTVALDFVGYRKIAKQMAKEQIERERKYN